MRQIWRDVNGQLWKRAEINHLESAGYVTLSLLLNLTYRGWDGRDSRVAMNLQKERAAVTIKVDPAAIKAVAERDGK